MRWFAHALLLLAVTALVPAAGAQWADPSLTSGIGLYVTESPDGGADALLVAPDAGTYTAYLVCANPWNENQDAAIATLGGYELELVMPSGWDIQDVSLPAGVLDLDSSGGAFYCAGLVPVSGDFVTLATLSLLSFMPGSGGVYVAPYAVPSIAGHMAITDGDDGFSLSRAVPSSGAYDLPVFGINLNIEEEDASWGSVKVLYR